MKSRKSTILFIGEPQSIYDPKGIKFDEIIIEKSNLPKTCGKFVEN